MPRVRIAACGLGGRMTPERSFLCGPLWAGLPCTARLVRIVSGLCRERMAARHQPAVSCIRSSQLVRGSATVGR